MSSPSEAFFPPTTAASPSETPDKGRISGAAESAGEGMVPKFYTVLSRQINFLFRPCDIISAKPESISTKPKTRIPTVPSNQTKPPKENPFTWPSPSPSPIRNWKN